VFFFKQDKNSTEVAVRDKWWWCHSSGQIKTDS